MIVLHCAIFALGPLLSVQEPDPMFERSTGDDEPLARSLRSCRGPAARAEFARRHKSQATAVDAGLAWLATQQDADGSFGDEGEGRIEATAAAVLAFGGFGHGPLEGPYAETVGRGLSWLVARQDRDGWIETAADADQPGPYLRAHSLATFVLVDASLIGGFPRLRERTSAALAALEAFEGRDPWRDVALAYGTRAGFVLHRARTSAEQGNDRLEAVAGAIFAAYMRAVDRTTRPPVPERVVDATLQVVEADDPTVVFLALLGLHQIGGPPWMRAEQRFHGWIRDQRSDGSWAAEETDTGSTILTAMRVLALEQNFLFFRFFRR